MTKVCEQGCLSVSKCKYPDDCDVHDEAAYPHKPTGTNSYREFEIRLDSSRTDKEPLFKVVKCDRAAQAIIMALALATAQYPNRDFVFAHITSEKPA